MPRPERFSVTVAYPVRNTPPSRGFYEPEGPHWLKDVAYAQVRRKSVNIRGNF